MIYLINSIVVPLEKRLGTALFLPLSFRTAKAIILDAHVRGDLYSAIGHQATAELLTRMLGIEIPYNRVAIKVKEGDIVIVFKLRGRLPEGKVIETLDELDKIGYEIQMYIVLPEYITDAIIKGLGEIMKDLGSSHVFKILKAEEVIT